MPKIKQLSLSLAQPFLKRAEPLHQSIDFATVGSILVYRPEKIGDLFVSLPLIDTLKTARPKLEITAVVSPAGFELVKDDPRFTRLIVFRKGFVGTIALMKELRSYKFDVVIDLVCDDSVTSLLHSHLMTTAKHYLGMGKRAHAPYYHAVVPYRTAPLRHVIDNTLSLSAAFDVKPGSPFAPPHIPSVVKDRAHDWIRNQFGGDNVIAINLSAGNVNRRWPDERYCKLIDLVLRDRTSRILLTATPGERSRALQIASQFSSDMVKVVPPDLGFIEVSAMIAQAALLVTPDTSLVHVARSMGVNVLGLYSPFMDNYRMWYPYGQEQNVVLSSDSSGIQDISAEVVSAAVSRILTHQKVGC